MSVASIVNGLHTDLVQKTKFHVNYLQLFTTFKILTFNLIINFSIFQPYTYVIVKQSYKF